MKYTRQNLINIYNATSKEHPKGSDKIESYEHWLERQLIARMAKIEKLEKQVAQQLPSQQRIKLLEELVKTYEAQPDDGDERDYYLWDKRIRELHKELSELSADAEEKVTDEMIEKWVDSLDLHNFATIWDAMICSAKAMRDGKIKPDADVPLKPINITVDRKTTRINRQFVNNLDILDIAVELGSIKQGEEDKYDVYKIVHGPENDLKLTNQMIDLYDSDMFPTEFYTVNNTPMIEGSNKY